MVGRRLPDESLVGEAPAILNPAELPDGQTQFRYMSWPALLLLLVFGTMYIRGRQRGGYWAVPTQAELGTRAAATGNG